MLGRIMGRDMRKTILAAGVTALLAACGGSGGGSAPAAAGNASPAGIYTGTITLGAAHRTDPIVGVVTAAGIGRFIDTVDGGAFAMQFTVTGTSATGTFSAYLSGLGAYAAFPNGSTYETGTQQATVVENASISGTFSASGDSGSFSLTSDPALYNLAVDPTSLAPAAGNFTGGTVSALDDCPTYAVANCSPPYPYRFRDAAITLAIQAGTYQLSGPCVLDGTIVADLHNAFGMTGGANCGNGIPSVGYSGLGFYSPASAGHAATFTFILTDAGGGYFAGVASR